MFVDNCGFMDPRGGNNRDQHLLPKHRVCRLAHSQQASKGGKCAHRTHCVPNHGYLHPLSALLDR